MKKEYDYLFKLVLIGDTCVGKSCLLVRFADDSFQENYLCTIGVDFRFRTLQINKSTIKLQIWDTAGQERYRTITNAYYKGADGIIIVFDITNKESFQNIDSWLDEIDKNVGEDVNIMIFANKSDLTNPEDVMVTEEEIAEFSKIKGIPVIKTSAKTGAGVDDSFIDMTKQLIQKKSQSGSTNDDRKKSMGIAFKRLQLNQEVTTRGGPQSNQSMYGCGCNQ